MCPSCRQPVLLMEGTESLRVGRGWLGSGSHRVFLEEGAHFPESSCGFPMTHMDGGVPLGTTGALPALFI